MPAFREPVLNVAVVGGVWHGKSTLIGRLLHELGRVSDRMVERMRRLASALGHEGSCYAFLVDKGLEERRRGHTLGLKAIRPLKLGRIRLKLIDLPGLLDRAGEAVPGISQADAALVVLSAPELTAEEVSLEDLRELLALCAAFGVEQAVVAVNKMDLADYGRSAFEEAMRTFEELLREVGWHPKAVYVPVSALRGDNLAESSDKMAWHDGPTLLEALERLEVPGRPEEGPVRLPVNRYYEAARAAVGVLRSGRLRPGDDVLVLPSGALGQVSSLQSWGRELDLALPGEDVGAGLRGVARYDVKKGSVVCGLRDVPPVARVLRARARVLRPVELRVGTCLTVCCHEAAVPARVEAIWSGEGRELKALGLGREGELLLRPLVPERRGLVVEPASRLRSMGLLAFRMGGGGLPATLTVAAGECLAVNEA